MSEAGIQDTSKEWGEPLEDQVLVRPVRLVKTPQGIDVPSTAKDPQPMVRVVAVGQRRHFGIDTGLPRTEEGPRVNPGDLVMLLSPAGSEVMVNGEVLGLTNISNLGMIYHNVDLSLRKEGVDEEERAKIMADAEAAAKIVQAESAPRLRSLPKGKRY